MEYFVFYLGMLGLRFLLFDHKHLRSVRGFLSRLWVFGWFFRELFKCSFCQGFWVGSAMAYAIGIDSYLFIFIIGLSSAMLSLIYVVIFNPILCEYERSLYG